MLRMCAKKGKVVQVLLAEMVQAVNSADVLFFWTLLFSDSTYQKKGQQPYFFGTIPMPS
jgi:hypothetical protein